MGAGRILMAVTLLVTVAGVVQADVTVVRQELQQGGFYIGRATPGSSVSWRGKAVPVQTNGTFVIGFDRHEPAEGWLKQCDRPEQTGDDCHVTRLDIQPRSYKTQNVKGVPGGTVNPDPAQLARTKADAQAIRAARATSEPKLAGFAEAFRRPSTGPVTGVYGSRRTYNGEERSWHKGGDFAAKTGTPVYAPASGKVVLARDTFMSGNLVMVDHGGGINSVYAHLSRMDVQPGDRVKAGDRLGAVGTTGRSTGPHLHWGLYWGSIALDPMLWLKAADRR